MSAKKQKKNAFRWAKVAAVEKREDSRQRKGVKLSDYKRKLGRRGNNNKKSAERWIIFSSSCVLKCVNCGVWWCDNEAYEIFPLQGCMPTNRAMIVGTNNKAVYAHCERRLTRGRIRRSVKGRLSRTGNFLRHNIWSSWKNFNLLFSILKTEFSRSFILNLYQSNLEFWFWNQNFGLKIRHFEFWFWNSFTKLYDLLDKHVDILDKFRLTLLFKINKNFKISWYFSNVSNSFRQFWKLKISFKNSF